MQFTEQEFESSVQRAQGALWVFQGEDYDPQPDWGDDPQPESQGFGWRDAMVVEYPDGEDYSSPEWASALALVGLEPPDVI